MSDFYRDMMVRERERLRKIRECARDALEIAIEDDDGETPETDIDCLVSARLILRLSHS